MFSQKLLLPAFAVFSAAAAQTSICATATATINSPADAAQYTGCPSLKNVFIGPEAAGILDLSGPTSISGDIVCHSAGGLISLTSSSIASIGGTFDLFNLTMLSTLAMTQLSSVKNINWSALQALGTLTFPTFISKADSVIITNTFLSTLDGINLKSVAFLDINNNNRLVKFETQVANITQGINIAANGKVLDISFPNLIFANNMTFRDVKSLSTPSLASVNGSLIFDNNFFSGYSAPNLTSVGNTGTSVGSLAFVGNTALTNITIPGLKTIGGGVQIANNSALQTISFPVLTMVNGAIDLSGNFSTPDLPALKVVKGALNIQSTATIDCSTLGNLHNTNVVQGKDTCISATSDPTTLTSGTATSGGSGSSAKPTSSKGAAASYGLSEAAAGLSVIGGLLGMLL